MVVLSTVPESDWWYLLYDEKANRVTIREKDGAWRAPYLISRDAWTRWLENSWGTQVIEADEIIDLGL